MTKKIILASIAIFITWTIIDMLIHGFLLGGMYQETAHLWRPMGEAKMTLNSAMVAISAFIFTTIYVTLVAFKSLRTALIYGGLLGVTTGLSMGFGTYSFMPIPLTLAIAWAVTAILEGMIGGFILSVLTKD